MSALAKLNLQPEWLAANSILETVMGSVAYGANLDKTNSDVDIYGIVIPPKNLLFPHTEGKIFGFDDYKTFDTWQQHKVPYNQIMYDISLFGIVKFFALAKDCNPNIIDMLYVPLDCVLKRTMAGQMVLDNRHLFLSKLVYQKFRGYAFSQLHKLRVVETEETLESIYKSVKAGNFTTKRKELNITGVDWKFAYHVVRLACECEQLLRDETMDLRLNKELYQAVRRGEWSIKEFVDWFIDQESRLEVLYQKTNLPERPETTAIKKLLLDCIETVYENLGQIVYIPRTDAEYILERIKHMIG